MKDCLADMRRSVNGLSANGRKLADFILNNAPLLRDYSSQQLAEAVGVSQSSVVKFSQKLGYRGYPDLKLAVSEDLVRGTSQGELGQIPKPPAHSSGSVFDDLAKTKADVLRNIAYLNSEELLLKIVRTIEDANRIQFIASGGYSLVVKDFALKLMIMGKSVVAESDLFMQRANLVSMKRGDVLFAICISGENSHIVELAGAAKDAGVTIITMTGHDANPLGLIADFNLFLCQDQSGFEASNSASHVMARVAIQHLIDGLILVLFNRNTHMRELLVDRQRALVDF